ncbi:MAG: tetratricopeptide repeat protein, partial [Planctomycetota bacterium JB042]
HGRLLDENLDRMAGLFFELGKAYFLSGNDSKMRIYLHKKAISIERARAEGRRLVKETSELAERAAPSREARSSLKRANDLLRGKRKLKDPKPARTALDNARRFLEECLILKSDHSAARLFLAGYFLRVDRVDEAIEEYHKLLGRTDVSKHHRALALQALGNAHGIRREYEKSVECYEEIFRSDLAGDDPRFFHVPLGLAMFLAKLGRFDKAVEAFGRVVENYPDKIGDARAILSRAEVFRGLLAERQAFRSELVTRYPMLFAS